MAKKKKLTQAERQEIVNKQLVKSLEKYFNTFKNKLN